MRQRAPSNEFQRSESETKITISLPWTHWNKISNWGQIKSLRQKSEEILGSEGKAVTPNNLIVAMFALITTTVSLPLATAESKNYTYWAYVPNLPLLKPVDWGGFYDPPFMLMILPGYQDLKIHIFLFLNKRKGLPSMLLMGMYPGQFVH